MGDRGNIVMRCSDGDIFFYTHWEGYRIPEIAREAIARRQRWNDEQYLTRIVFCTMVAGHESGETSFGITRSMHDNSYPLLIIDCEKQQVFLEAPPEDATGRRQPSPAAHAVSFADFANLEAADWGTFDPSMAEAAE